LHFRKCISKSLKHFCPPGITHTDKRDHPMRALCGSIITAGALIGLGLVALAYGIRFHGYGPESLHPNSHDLYGIPTLVLILVVMIIGTLTGIGVAFIGLAYHHERRFYEKKNGQHTPRIEVPS
jgi:hypothetical protein